MIRMSTIPAALLAAATALSAGSAAAQSAFNWNTLVMSGEATPRPWCGQWWGHRCNGVAINSKNNRAVGMSCSYSDAQSPVEKLDAALGRTAKIEYAKLDTWLQCALKTWADCQTKRGS